MIHERHYYILAFGGRLESLVDAEVISTGEMIAVKDGSASAATIAKIYRHLVPDISDRVLGALMGESAE